MKKRKKRIYDDDDGRTIASMNVDGMPWNRGGADLAPSDAEKDETREELMLTASEKRAMAGGVFAAAFLVAGVFILAGFLFILFCVKVWLR